MKKLRLFASCIPVKGAKRSVICDVQRGTYKLIPNTLFDFITTYENYSIIEIQENFEIDEQESVGKYINFLLESEFAFLTDHPEYFPKLNLQWKSSTTIANAVIDNYGYSNHNYHQIIQSLNVLRCQHLEIRFFSNVSASSLYNILTLTDNSTLKSIDLLLKYEDDIKSRLSLQALLKKFPRINNVFIHSTNETLVFELNTDDNLFFTSQVINDESHCGIIDKFNFSSNIHLFTESLNFNNCLNRKISVDGNGQIKNCPSMKTSYGHLSDVSLEEIANEKNFRKVWEITKDQINICKDCEFRYICTDCRVYLQNGQDLYSKPMKCNYDPYSGEWKN